jgi:hypothetical protein
MQLHPFDKARPCSDGYLYIGNSHRRHPLGADAAAARRVRVGKGDTQYSHGQRRGHCKCRFRHGQVSPLTSGCTNVSRGSFIVDDVSVARDVMRGLQTIVTWSEWARGTQPEGVYP